MAAENTLESRTGNVENNSFHIEELADSFRLHNAPYDGGLAVLTWDKEYLDGGRTHNQQEWLRLSDNVPDIVDYHATITSLTQNWNGPQSALVKKVSKMFQEDFKKYWMATSTRIIYTPCGKDEIVHNYGSDRETRVKVDFVGHNSWITAKNGFEEQMEALLGTGNLKEIEESYIPFTGRKPYLSRFNSRPTHDTEGAVWVGPPYTDRFGLVCDNYPFHDLGRSRGVRVESAEGVQKNQGSPYRIPEKTPEEVLKADLREALSFADEYIAPRNREAHNASKERKLEELYLRFKPK